MLGGVLRTRLALAVMVGAGLFWAALTGTPAISGAFAGTSDAQTSSSPSAALIAQLAALQRPQTPADVLPSGRKLPARGQGTIIPALTRLLATPAGAGLYLAVFTPPRGSLPLWSPSLGDQVSLVSVTAQSAELTQPVPATDLADGNSVAIIGASSRPPYQLGSEYYAGIVPDGVARVAWTFANVHGKHPYVVNAQTANNVVVAPFHSSTPFLLRAIWYAADGSIVPTSDSALLHAIAARQNIQRKRIIRQDAHLHYRPAGALLTAFAVFTSPAGPA